MRLLRVSDQSVFSLEGVTAICRNDNSVEFSNASHKTVCQFWCDDEEHAKKCFDYILERLVLEENLIDLRQVGLPQKGEE